MLSEIFNGTVTESTVFLLIKATVFNNSRNQLARVNRGKKITLTRGCSFVAFGIFGQVHECHVTLSSKVKRGCSRF